MSDTSDATEPAEPSAYEAAYARLHSMMSSWLRVLLDTDQCLEIRCLNVQDGAGQPGSGRTSTQSGWFDGTEIDAIIRTAINYSGLCSGVYYTMNPLRDRWGKRARLLNGVPTRMDKSRRDQVAGDADVIERRWFLVDVDPVKAKGHEKDSATDGEKAAAFETVKKVQEWMLSYGPPGILSDSGNGYHLLYRWVAGTEVSGSMTLNVKRLLRTLDSKFTTPFANVDKSVFNAGRIVKMPGTKACKGVESDDRPWRRAKVLEIPGEGGGNV